MQNTREIVLIDMTNAIRKLMNMKNSIKDIWREMDIQVSIFREVGRSVMVVEFFTSATGMLNLRFQNIRTASGAGLGR